MLSEYQQKFLYGIIQWKDQSNDVISHKDISDSMIVLNPSLSINHAWYYYTNTFLVKYKDILSVNFKAQKTTTRRTGIMFSQKYI